MTTALAERGPVSLAEGQRPEATEAAERVGRILEQHPQTPMLTVMLDDESRVTVPVPALALLADILREMGRGHAVLIVPYGAELTTQQAADLLNVSRPYVVKLIESGELSARKVGPRRRVRYEDLMAYKSADDDRRRDVARQLTQEAEETETGYVTPTTGS